MGRALHIAAVVAAITLAHPGAFAGPRVEEKGHGFAAIGHASGDEEQLERALDDANEARVDFIVATGVKSATEPCSDKLYTQRRELLDASRRPLVVSLAASDWTACRNSAGRTNAIERLNRLRELYFFDSATLGKKKLDVKRLSASEKFRSYAENAHWEVDGVLYATVNVPSDNNHFLRAAGRNSEYEDRLVANRSWLRRLFAMARQRDLTAVVLFTEADIWTPRSGRALSEDGFAELRAQLETQSKRYTGKVLLVDSAPLDKGERPEIEWRRNVGHLSLGSSSVQVKVTPGEDTHFSLVKPEAKAKAKN